MNSEIEPFAGDEVSDVLELPTYADEILRGLPAADLVDLLARDQDRVPRNLVEECVRRGEEIEHLLTPIFNEERVCVAGWLPLHAVHILGAQRSESAGHALVAAMRALQREDELLDWCLGSWQSWFMNKPQNVMPALAELVHDRISERQTRLDALLSLIAMGQCAGAESLDEQIDVAARVAADETENTLLRADVADLLLDFPRSRHRALLESLVSIVHGAFTKHDIAEAFAQASDRQDWDPYGKPLDFYDPAEIEARVYGALEREEPFWDDESLAPYVRETPKIGRNDPCPCGSGKKYKKCCLCHDSE